MAFRLFVVGYSCFCFCALVALVIFFHLFVADTSLLDCCDLVVCFFSTLCLQAGPRLGFEEVLAVLFLSFGVSCLLAWSGQPFFIIGESCHKYVCRDISCLSLQNASFVPTKVSMSRQTCFCRDKTFIVTNICRDKHNFVATKLLSRLSRRKLYLLQLPSMKFFRLPPAFVICSFFLCHRHLCTASFFHGLFCL